MLKPYNELVKVDVKPHCKKRDEMLYLPWAKCKELLHENGAERVAWIPLTNEKGSSLFMSDREFTGGKSGLVNRCYEVRIKVIIDDLEFEFQAPVMNGSNPVQDNSMTQQRVWNAQTRAFVKGVAMFTGLGFSLWSGEEIGEDLPSDDADDLYKHNILCIKERVERLITVKMDSGISKSEICAALKIDEERLEMYLKRYEVLDQFEKAIQRL